MTQTAAVTSLDSESLLQDALRGEAPARAAGGSTRTAQGGSSAILGSLLPILAGF